MIGFKYRLFFMSYFHYDLFFFVWKQLYSLVLIHRMQVSMTIIIYLEYETEILYWGNQSWNIYNAHQGTSNRDNFVFGEHHIIYIYIYMYARARRTWGRNTSHVVQRQSRHCLIQVTNGSFFHPMACIIQWLCSLLQSCEGAYGMRQQAGVSIQWSIGQSMLHVSFLHIYIYIYRDSSFDKTQFDLFETFFSRVDNWRCYFVAIFKKYLWNNIEVYTWYNILLIRSGRHHGFLFRPMKKCVAWQ